MNVGAQWFLAGWEKIKEPAVWGTSGVALKGFVAGRWHRRLGLDPAVQGWYANFLQHFVLPNVGLFSFLVTWGEVAVGLGLLLGALTGIASGFGVLMNLNYLLAGTVSINPVIGSVRHCSWSSPGESAAGSDDSIGSRSPLWDCPGKLTRRSSASPPAPPSRHHDAHDDGACQPGLDLWFCTAET